MVPAEMNDAEVVAAARRVIERQIVGVFTSVDGGGQPHSRWMLGQPSGEGLDKLLAVSTRGSRKLDQLKSNGKVCWLFSDAHDDEVVTIVGTARILEDQTKAGPAWDHLHAAAETYSMNVLSEAENLWFVGIETTVTQVEYMNPKAGLTHPVVVKLG